MKKYFLIIVLLLFIKVDAFATDACDRLVPQYASFVWKVVMGSNLRDYPCISKSNVLWASRVWDNYAVISKVDGWYQVRLDDWKVYRIRDRAIEKTSNTVTYEPVEEVKEEVSQKINIYSWYVLTRTDTVLVNKLMYKFNQLIQEKWSDFRDLLLSKLSDLLIDWWYSSRLLAILEEIHNQIIQNEIDLEKKK